MTDSAEMCAPFFWVGISGWRFVVVVQETVIFLFSLKNSLSWATQMRKVWSICVSLLLHPTIWENMLQHEA